MNDDIAFSPEEDELVNRCCAFMDLLSDKGAIQIRNALFRSIAITTRLRAKKELMEYGYTQYPLLFECIKNKDRLRKLCTIYSGEMEEYVAKVMEVLKEKKSVAMAMGGELR